MLDRGQRENDPNPDWEMNSWHSCIHDGIGPCKLREAQGLGQIMWACELHVSLIFLIYL